MEEGDRQSSLCSRCGAVIEPPVFGPDGRGEGACPDCGLGFSSMLVTMQRKRGVAERWARWRGQRSLRAHRSERERVLRRRRFPIYGLDARWIGLRWVGGWGGSDTAVQHIGLGYGDPYDDRVPLVRVFTWRLSSPTDRMTAVNAAHDLAHYLWHEGGHDVIRPAFTSDDPTGTWSEMVLPVDGEPVMFRSLAAGAFWVALGRVGADLLVTVQARHVDPAGIDLVTVDDVEPYLADIPSPH